MPRLQLNFLGERTTEPTDEQLLLQLVYGLGESLRNGENLFLTTQQGIPTIHIRRLMKILIKYCNLPIPEERADEWIEWHKTNQCWFVDKEISDRANELKKLSKRNE